MLLINIEMNMGGELRKLGKLKIALSFDGTIADHTSLVIILSAILDDNHHQKSQKMAIITHRINIETCNQNQTPLSLGQSSTLTCQPSWILAIISDHKNGNYNSESQHRDLQPNPTKFGLMFNLNIMSAILDFSHYQKSQKWQL